ncbi:kinase-like domain-containing protein [Leptodontidium sp. 2 PMI_412]|nr:kinase-like domain-containing protein [Leptodontidium sp. 2 PMI_412]
MPLSIGQALRGRAASYHITNVLKAPTVFQAKIIPFEHPPSSQPAPLAVIKNFPTELSQTQYNRELHNYILDSIARSPFVRSFIDLIGHDEPLSFVAAVFKTLQVGLRVASHSGTVVLEALAVLDGEEGVHTDINPNNVFLSGVNGPSPVVKLGDLGNLMAAGPMLKARYQGIVIRAPEVWKDIPITPKADIWSLGVTLAHWLAGKTIFGPADKIVEGLSDHWCIAKLMRLFALAEYFEKETFVHPETGLEERFIKVGSIRQELEKVEGPIERECIDFIESLLIVDPIRRPSAREALQHPWFRNSTGYDSDWSVD